MSAAFAAELDRLVQELWTWSPSRFGTADRQQVLRDLAQAWAVIAHGAGGEAPSDAVLPHLEVHALADQLAVLGREVLRAPHVERAATEALEHLVAARSLLLRHSGPDAASRDSHTLC